MDNEITINRKSDNKIITEWEISNDKLKNKSQKDYIIIQQGYELIGTDNSFAALNDDYCLNVVYDENEVTFQ